MLSLQVLKTRALRVLAIYRIDLRKPRRSEGIGNSMLALSLAAVIVGILPHLMPLDFSYRDMVVAIIIDAVVILAPTIVVMHCFADGWQIFDRYLLKLSLDYYKMKLGISVITRLLVVVIIYSSLPFLGLILDRPLPVLGLGEAVPGLQIGLVVGMLMTSTFLMMPSCKRWIKWFWQKKRWRELKPLLVSLSRS